MSFRKYLFLVVIWMPPTCFQSFLLKFGQISDISRKKHMPSIVHPWLKPHHELDVIAQLNLQLEKVPSKKFESYCLRFSWPKNSAYKKGWPIKKTTIIIIIGCCIILIILVFMFCYLKMYMKKVELIHKRICFAVIYFTQDLKKYNNLLFICIILLW